MRLTVAEPSGAPPETTVTVPVTLRPAAGATSAVVLVPTTHDEPGAWSTVGSMGVTVNDPRLTLWSLPTLTRVAGDDNVVHIPRTGGGEDFSYFQKEIPGVFYFIGITPRGQDPSKAPSNHSPHFYVDEQGLLLGLRLIAHLVVDFQSANPLIKA